MAQQLEKYMHVRALRYVNLQFLVDLRLLHLPIIPVAICQKVLFLVLQKQLITAIMREQH